MKTFIYTKTQKPATYGTKVTLSIYHVKNNTPVYVGEVKYNTQSYRGEDHEVAVLLLEHKLISKNALRSGGYIIRDIFESKYKLVRL